MENEAFFWRVMDLLNWNCAGDDSLVLAPALRFLARRSDEEIFSFEDTMARLLHNLDSRKIAQSLYKDTDSMSADLLLYQRCMAVVNGQAYYEAVRSGSTRLNPDLEFESVLYLPANAWAKKHRRDPEDYPHTPGISYESLMNQELWK